MPPEQASENAPFLLNLQFRSRFKQIIFDLVKIPVQKIFGLSRLNRKYQNIPERTPGFKFTGQTLEALNIGFEFDTDDLNNIPAEGPLVVVGNHPFGMIEGVLIAHLLGEVRPDLKIMGNFILARIPEMRPLLITVDPYGTKSSLTSNLRPMKDSLEWLNSGGALAVFPAGEVSHQNWSNGRSYDIPWSKTVARLIRSSRAQVVPVFFEGNNSWIFHALGLIHPRMKTALLPRQLLNKSGKTITACIGKSIRSQKIETICGNSELAEYLRMRTYLLDSKSGQAVKTALSKNNDAENSSIKFTRIMTPIDKDNLESEIAGLPEETLLSSNSEFQVFCTRTGAIPNILQEIGRLRELTFRQAGEGTGKAIDLDRFDNYYYHLFVWNSAESEIVGSYRLGLTREILDKYGLNGLYTRTLFHYNNKLMAQINPAIELGRSFIRPEYQKMSQPLNLLWKGIGQFVLRHPDYHILFGTVSISNDFQSISRELLISFLKANKFSVDLSKLVRPKTPPRTTRSSIINEHVSGKVISDVKEISSLIYEIEANQKSIPILLKHYLRLGGKLLGFNVDYQFGDALDGLILVDLLKTDRRILEHYMGRDGYLEFVNAHSVHRPVSV